MSERENIFQELNEGPEQRKGAYREKEYRRWKEGSRKKSRVDRGRRGGRKEKER